MPLLVVLGATGHQGGGVLNHFLSNPDLSDYKLRGVTRDVGSSASRKLESLGVEMVQADVGDSQSMRDAFRDASHIFANTDSNQLIFKALKDPSLLPPGQTAAEYGVAKEKQFGANIIEAAALTPSLQRIIWSSLPSPKKQSNGKYSKVVMFDTKDDIATMFEEKPELKDKLSILLFGFYLDNAVRVPDLYAPKRQQDGVYEIGFPMSGDAPVPLADVSADAGLWVQALCDAPPGTKLLGVSQTMSWSQWLSAWGRHLKLPVRYTRLAPDEFAKHMPGLQKAISEEFQYVGEYGFTGGDPIVKMLESLNPALSKSLSSVESHLSRTDWSPIVHS